MNFTPLDREDGESSSGESSSGEIQSELRAKIIAVETFQSDYHRMLIRAMVLKGEADDCGRKVLLLRTLDKDMGDLGDPLIERLLAREAEKTSELHHVKGELHAMKAVLRKPRVANRYLCFVCLENSVDTFLDPCGHVLCASCTLKSSMVTHPFLCPGCRTIVSEPKKMFMLS
jgi:hypothetical protein